MNATRICRIVIVAGAMFSCLAAAGSNESDILVKIHSLMPGQSEDWDSASGVEVQARFWGDQEAGAALVLGLDSWTARSEYSEEEDQYSYLATSIAGSMTAIPIGASLLCRSPMGRSTAVVLEAGLRYVIIESDINVETDYADAYGTTYTRDRIDSENGLVGLIGIGLETALQDRIFIRCGLDYQFDLMKPAERFLGEDLGKTSLRAVSINAGIGWSF